MVKKKKATKKTTKATKKSPKQSAKDSKPMTVTQLRREEIVNLKEALKLGRDDLLQAEQVVEAARSKKKYPNLHSGFEWSDTKAAHEYRLQQARHIIVSVYVVRTHRNKEIRVQEYSSLRSDQQKTGGGYRETVSVLSDKEMREELLGQAWDEFNYWRSKYEQFRELGPIFEAADKLAAKNKKKGK